MGDTAAGPVFRLVYASHSLIASGERRAALGAIFTTARRTNRNLGVTGALMTSSGAFVQALEGEERVVRDLYAAIAGDPRHDNVTVLEAGDVERRVFGRWAMAQVAEDGGPDIRLMSNARAGTIVAVTREDRSITPEQEAVLMTMRDALSGVSLDA